MSQEWEQLPLPGEVREGSLEEVTSEWGFAGVPDSVAEEEQGLGLLRMSYLAISIPHGLPIVNPNFHLSLCVCEECQNSYPRVISGINRTAFSLNGGLPVLAGSWEGLCMELGCPD